MSYNRIKRVLPILISVMLLAMGISCKEKTQTAPPDPVPEIKAVKTLSPVYKEIAGFMDLEVSDSTEIDTIFTFKVYLGQDSVVTSDAEQNLKFYKDIMKNGKADALPIFEAKASDLSLLMFTGKGYLGAIWARAVVDHKTGEIVKVRFAHKMESDGYGNGIVNSVFADQFSGRQISAEGNTYGLTQSGNQVIEGEFMVDGVSGATITSTAVVQMLNDGLQEYGAHLMNDQ